MSFYTALTGLNGSQADISATSNNIANVGTTGFKRSRAEFGDIFATSPLQNSSSSIGSGTILKGIKQQFTQGNIVSSLNALDLAISGQGFFALKPSLTSNQTVYTRNGSLNVNNDRYVVDSAGQYLSVYPVNDDGSVTAKDLLSAVPLQLPVTSGDPRATGNIELGVNVPAAAAVVTEQAQFADGYEFNPDDPATFTNSTSITIFDDLGNPTIATIYFIKTQNASAADPTNKFDTRLVINDTVITPDLVNAVDDSGSQIFIDRFGTQTTTVPDDNYFLEGKGSPLYKADSLQSKVPSQPASLKGEQTAFDFGEEGDKLVEIVTDPMQFNSTKEAGNAEGNIFWGRDFLLVNIDDGDQPVSIDIRPGKYNAEQLAAEVERAINEAYGDDKKIQIVQNVDDALTIDLIKLDADGVSTGLTNKISVDLLVDSFVSQQIPGLDVNGASPDFTLEQFLAHTQARINTELNEHVISTNAGTGAETAQNSEVGVSSKLFARTSATAMTTILEKTQIVEFEYRKMDATSQAMTTEEKYLMHSYYGLRPELSVYNERVQTAQNASGNTVEYDAAQNTLSIQLTGGGAANFVSGETIRLGGVFANATGDTLLNGRELTIFSVDSGNDIIKVDTTGLSLPDTNFTEVNTTVYALRDEASDVEAFFEGAENVYEGSAVNFNSKKIVLREMGATNLHSYTATELADVSRQITVTETVNGDASAITTNAMVDGGGESQVIGVGDTVQLSFGHNEADYTFTIAGAGSVSVTISGATTSPFSTAIDNALATINADANLTATRVGDKLQIAVANSNATISNVQSATGTTKGIFEVTGATLSLTDAAGAPIDALETMGLQTTADADATTTKTVWVDERQPPVKVGYDEINQRLTFKVDRTVL
ncbi:MAG: flagellar hook-basal body complex protein, partial [PS1 clade bacterium]|nr:flagellar hook-basal body complex protein [PS1 clade bacterium]